jgi:hypothetical protein
MAAQLEIGIVHDATCVIVTKACVIRNQQIRGGLLVE